MHGVQLSGIDLNLLVVLDALLDTRSVKLAARRVALSPSAASHALARLRHLLGDPILVRVGRELVPSPRAGRLRGELRSVLDGVERLLGPEEVEPARLRRRFTIACSDYAELVVLPALSRRIAKLAPGVDLQTRPAGADPVAALRAGDCELFVGVCRVSHRDVGREPLFDDDFVCVLRRGHPALRRRWTAEAFAALEHVLVAPTGEPRGVVDLALGKRGLARRVARTCTTSSSAPRLVAGSDYVLTLSARIARELAAPLGLVLRRPPLDLPRFTIAQAWHRGLDGDRALDWLRTAVADAVTSPERASPARPSPDRRRG